MPTEGMVRDRQYRDVIEFLVMGGRHSHCGLQENMPKSARKRMRVVQGRAFGARERAGALARGWVGRPRPCRQGRRALP